MDEQFNEIVNNLKQKNNAVGDKKDNLTSQLATVKGLDAVQKAVVQSVKVLTQALLNEKLNVTVTNQPETVETPDAITGAEMVKAAIKDLQWTIAGKNSDYSPLVANLEAILEALGKLPTEHPSFPEMPSEMAINNLGDVITELKALTEKVASLELAPQITVSPAEVKVEAPVVNVKIEKELKNLEEAIKELKPADNSEQAIMFHEMLVAQMAAVEKAIKDIVIPVPNNKPTYVDSNGKGTPVEISNGSIPTYTKSVTERYDYNDTTTIYTGSAPVGTSDSAAGWTIYKYDLTDSDNASGKVATNVSWTNRTAGTFL